MQLVKYLFTVIIASLLITGVGTWVINKGLVKSGVDFYGKINAAGDSTKNTSLLLVGSSRMLVQLDPKILDSITGLQSYNYGFNAGAIKTCYNIIKYGLHFQKQTKAVVLNIDYNMFNAQEDPYKDAYYYPFEKNVPGLVMTDSGKSKWIHKLQFLDIALYDDFVKFAAIDGWLRPGRTVAGLYHGYYPHRELNDFVAPEMIPNKKIEVPVTALGMALLDSCIRLCKQNNVLLALVIAPYFSGHAPEKYYTNYTEIINRVKNTARQNGIPVYDLAQMPLANDPHYFYNVNHLNIAGATIYSAAIADSLQHYLIKPVQQK